MGEAAFHIDLLPRLRARKHKMLYKTIENADYENLNSAIHGVIQWRYIRKYYDDILRILVSFYERKAKSVGFAFTFSCTYPAKDCCASEQ